MLSKKLLEQFLNGVKLSQIQPDGIYKIYSEEGVFIGTGEIKDSKLKRDVIILE